MAKDTEDKFHHWLSLSAAGVAGAAGAVLLGRVLLGQVFRWSMTRIFTDEYGENLLESLSVGKRLGIQNILETNLRSEEGKAIKRPLGSPNLKFPGFGELVFNLPQLHRRATPLEISVDLSITIGPTAKKPLSIPTPLIIAPMAYGEALTEGAKLALAKGASQAGAAINSGEGPFLPGERRLAKHYIFQYNRGHWTKDPGILKQADAVEIQIGQGASAGAGHTIPAQEIDARLRGQMNLKPKQDAVIHAWQEGTGSVDEFAKLVTRIRNLTEGVPVGAKIGAGMDIEKDVNFLVRSGVDFISIDGAQAATKGSPPILQDDFGIPTLYALCRAVRELKRLRASEKVSLLVGGGLFTPGDFLKALALGADGVYIGTIALFAMTHTQNLQALPFEPPTQVVWYTGKRRKAFNWQQGAVSLAKFLKSCSEEMAIGLQALGKKSLGQLSPDDLCGLTPHICEVASVKSAWKE